MKAGYINPKLWGIGLLLGAAALIVGTEISNDVPGILKKFGNRIASGLKAKGFAYLMQTKPDHTASEKAIAACEEKIQKLQKAYDTLDQKAKEFEEKTLKIGELRNFFEQMRNLLAQEMEKDAEMAA